MTQAPEPTLPLSLDWEDWFQLCCPPYEAPDALDRFACRLPQATELALELCEELGARATWFCLADQARRHPALLRRIRAAGHRIALHGISHQRAFELDRPAFRRALADGKRRLEDLAGCAVTGFRAPEWSLRGEAEDHWRELPEAGFSFDSSRAPVAFLGSPRHPRRPHLLAEGLWELPPPVLGLGPAAVPLWGWPLRILPTPVLRTRLVALARERAGTPLALHPWELDEGQPGLPEAPRLHRFAHRAGLRGFGTKLRALLDGIALVSLEDWIAGQAPSLVTGREALCPAP